LAVFRLMNSSTFVACTTGRSAGFSPLDVAFAASVHDMNLPSKRTCRHFVPLSIGLGSQVGRVYEQANHGGVGNHLAQQLFRAAKDLKLAIAA
jgi:hypothetical protein